MLCCNSFAFRSKFKNPKKKGRFINRIILMYKRKMVSKKVVVVLIILSLLLLVFSLIINMSIPNNKINSGEQHVSQGDSGATIGLIISPPANSGAVGG